MPNWCFSTYQIEGKKEEMEALYNKMKELQEMPETLIDNGFGVKWLGNLVEVLGGDWNSIGCRGTWDDLEYDGYTVSFTTETAWNPCFETFELVERIYPSLKIYYTAEEEGNDYYITNDREGKYFPERYWVDTAQDDVYQSEYFSDEESMYKWLEEKYGVKNEEEVEAWNDDYEETGDDDENFINIHKFEIVD